MSTPIRKLVINGYKGGNRWSWAMFEGDRGVTSIDIEVQIDSYNKE